MNIAGIIFLVLIAIIAYLFIYLTVKINSMDAEIRDKNSEIDGNLWDRAFQLSKLVEILQNKSIENDIEVVDVNTFGLGMAASMQSLNCEKLDFSDEKLRAILKEHPELEQDEEFGTHLAKFNNARVELKKGSLEYNKRVSKYNSFISGFPVSFIAAFHKKSEKPSFTHYFKEFES
ncbi:MAG: LemA family protein [Eubacterium sp.]|nr:LemA family protein [Eubacterium sp.]